MTTASGKPEAAQEGQSSTFLQPLAMQVRRLPTLANSVLGLILLLSVCLSACGGSDPRPASARANVAPVVPVSVATAERRDIPYFLTGLGSVTAYYTVSVKSRVDGELMQVNFKEGQNVHKGDVLALIDPRPYQVALDQAQATQFKDQAALRDAKLNYDRYKQLLQESGAMSQQQVDTQKATANQFEGAVRNDQAAIDSAKLNLVYCHITAPVSGRIGLRQVDPGNIVHANDTNAMFVITQLQPIAVLFTLPEDNLQTVSRQMAKNTLTVDAYGRDNQTKLATGKLLTIDNEIDPTTGTGKLKAVFDNKDNALWPNQFVNIRLLLEVRKNSTAVPAAAIQRGPQGTYVFVTRSDNTVNVRPVTIAFTQDNVSVIASGISPSEVVVTDGQDKLQEGSKIEIRPATPSGNPPQASGSNGSGGPSPNAQHSGTP
ncbi:MAG TPA: MdtA/MuxA family multidrug efflux RND transporter periplasmic adaptor subunit [Terriglobales bacterium]|nr:MdtA/MuxA family multidrug efflux RND transporter periplasmic adaptor subunit [Terriglobales bacterium]